MAVLACVLLSVGGVGHAWHYKRNEQLRREVQENRARLQTLQKVNQDKAREIELSRSHQAIEARVRELNLGLEMPRFEQILPIVEPPRGVGQTPADWRLAEATPRP